MKQYTVFRRPKVEDALYSIPENNRVFDEFKDAIAAMNSVRLAKRMPAIIAPPRPLPIVVELPHEWMELWIIDRPLYDVQNGTPSGHDLRGSERPVRMDNKIY